MGISMQRRAFCRSRVLRVLFPVLMVTVVAGCLKHHVGEQATPMREHMIASETGFPAFDIGQTVSDFRLEVLYRDGRDRVIGGRFVHHAGGMPVDVFTFESVPQMLLTVSTPPDSDKGEPHTGEHLVLGKGGKGKYMSLAMDMLLGTFSAATYAEVTAYHFNTEGGQDAFYAILDPFIDTLMHPDFTDEEIKREVCHIGVFSDPKTGLLSLDEKGTIYNEMISSAEKPYWNVWQTMNNILFGAEHPLGYNSGGVPEAIRKMTPEDIRLFHERCYQFNASMNVIFFIPPSFSVEHLLQRFSTIVDRIQRERPVKTAAAASIPPFAVDTDRETIRIVGFPGQVGSAQGTAYCAWPPAEQTTLTDVKMLEMLLAALGNGEGSLLYKDLVDASTRKIQPAPTEVQPFVYHVTGYPKYVYFGGLDEQAMTEPWLASLRSIVVERLKWLASLEDNSPALREFNERFEVILAEQERELRQTIESPPRFGYRSTGIWWYRYLSLLNKETGQDKSLAMTDFFRDTRERITSGTNIHRNVLERFGLLELPFMVATKADPTLIDADKPAREQRLALAARQLKEQYATSDEQEALRRYREEFDQRTAELDRRDQSIEGPAFIANPPLEFDPGLIYRLDTSLAVPFVWVDFEGMTFHESGFALDLRSLSPAQFGHLAILPEVITDIGVRDEQGKTIAFDVMKDSLRRDIGHLTVGFSSNPATARVELKLLTGGASVSEGQRGLMWMKRGLTRTLLTTENLPRIRDVVNQKISSLRDLMNGPEEDWYSDITQPLLYQDDPLMFTVNSPLTRLYDLYNLQWRLEEAPGPALENLTALMLDAGTDLAGRSDQTQVYGFLETVRTTAGKKGPGLEEAAFAPFTSAASPVMDHFITAWHAQRTTLSDSQLQTLATFTECLRDNLNSFPASDFSRDFETFGRDMLIAWRQDPATILADLERTVKTIREHSAVRGVFVGNKSDAAALTASLRDVLSLFTEASASLKPKPLHQRADVSGGKLIVARLADRYPELARGLPATMQAYAFVKKDTQNSILSIVAPGWTYNTTDPNELIKLLSLSLMGGGGAHGIFMQTWGEGLAYSNGMWPSPDSGQIVYYAERCQSPVQTITFVSRLLQQADSTLQNQSLVDYALTTMIGHVRSGNDFVQRGRSMADNLADGITPAAIREFRTRMLELRTRPDLLAELKAALPGAAGRLLAGYGVAMTSDPETVVTIIGPEQHITAFEQFLDEKEPGAPTFYRVWPRDFWQRRMTTENN